MAEEKAFRPRQRRASAISKAIGNLTRRGKGVWIIALLFLEKNPGMPALEKMIREKLLAIPRFRSKYKDIGQKGYFVEVDPAEMDMDYHLSTILEDKPATRDDWLNFAGTLSNAELYDLDKPLWKFFLVPELESGGSLLVASINHGIGDGVSQLGVLNRIIDEPIDMKARAEKTKDKVKMKPVSYLNRREKVGWFLWGIKDGLTGFLGAKDTRSDLRLKNISKVSVEKKVALTNSISLAEVKQLKNKFPGSTVNDVLLAVLSMALVKYLKEIDDPVLKKKNPTIRGNFPVNMKGFSLKKASGNDFASIAFRFPLKFENRIEAMYKVKKQLDGLKASPAAIVQKVATKGLGKTVPTSLLITLVQRVNNKVTSMLSNVPGPDQKVSIAGTPVDDIQFLAYAPLGMYMGLISYNGKVSASIAMDTSVEVDPQGIAKYWDNEFNAFVNDCAAYPETVPLPK